MIYVTASNLRNRQYLVRSHSAQTVTFRLFRSARRRIAILTAPPPPRACSARQRTLPQLAFTAHMGSVEEESSSGMAGAGDAMGTSM